MSLSPKEWCEKSHALNTANGDGYAGITHKQGQPTPIDREDYGTIESIKGYPLYFNTYEDRAIRYTNLAGAILYEIARQKNGPAPLISIKTYLEPKYVKEYGEWILRPQPVILKARTDWIRFGIALYMFMPDRSRIFPTGRYWPSYRYAAHFPSWPFICDLAQYIYSKEHAEDIIFECGETIDYVGWSNDYRKSEVTREDRDILCDWQQEILKAK